MVTTFSYKMGHWVCILSHLFSLPKLPTSLLHPVSPSMRNKDLNRTNNIGATIDPSTPLDQPPPPLPTLPPEIHHMIIARLDQGTLASCARVSKAFRNFSTPFFWKVVDVSSTEKLIRFLRECTQKALTANAGYIQKLALFHTELCAIFIPAHQGPSAVSSFYDPESLYIFNSVYCTQLRKLWIWCRPPPEEWHKTTQCYVEYEEIVFTEDMAQDYVALVRRNPHLRSLKIDQQLSTSTFLDLALDSAPALQELDFLSDVDKITSSLQFTLKLFGSSSNICRNISRNSLSSKWRKKTVFSAKCQSGQARNQGTITP